MKTPFDRRAIPVAAVEGFWHAPDGAAIRRVDWPNGGRRGSLLFMPGRGDAYEKYLEALDQWAADGWRVTAMDWRGQARSGRLGADKFTGHVGDFADWIGDLRAFWSEWKMATPGPHVLICHSMGGHLGLRAMAEAAVDPDAAVITAPMLGFGPAHVPDLVLHGVAQLMTRIGDRRRSAWSWGEKPTQPPDGRPELLTHDADRYADEMWWRDHRPDIAMGPPSWGWIERAYESMRLLRRPGMLEKIATPVLLIATSADRLVSGAEVVRAAKRLKRSELLLFGAESRHEILRETDPVRDKAMAAIADFLDRNAPPPHRSGA